MALPFNFALHAAQAFPDAEIHLLSAVGEDVGPVFAARLDAAGIRHDLVRVVNTPSLGVRRSARRHGRTLLLRLRSWRIA